MKASLLVSLSTTCGLAFFAAEAKAVYCVSPGACFTVENGSTEPQAIAFIAAGMNAIRGETGGNGTGVEGQSSSGYGVKGYSSSGAGVYGQSSISTGVSGVSTSGHGVYGSSFSGVGIQGTSSSWNGVVGQNGRTDWVAAAVAALPGNSNGLAIWAGGGVQKPGGGSWAATSDVRVKKDVKGFRAGLIELKQLRPVSYKYNGLGKTQDDGNEFVGVIAQELEKVVPSMVTSHKGKLRPGDSKETDIKHVDPSAFTYVLINAVQEQQKIIERQEARIAKLERGDAPLVAFGNLGGGLALGLIPLGLIAVHRRRKESSGG
jgi:hypothetical protein